MKTTLAAALLAALAIAAPARAQHPHEAGHAGPAKVTKDAGHAGHSNEHMSGWKALDDYHMVMMKAWHPAKDSRNLAPARAAADSLAASADAWAASAVPAACDTPAARAGVAKVRDDSRAFAAQVKAGASDEALFPALKALHDGFETVNRGCKAHH